MSQHVSFAEAKTIIGVPNVIEACGVSLPENVELDELPSRELHKLLHFHGECHE